MSLEISYNTILKIRKGIGKGSSKSWQLVKQLKVNHLPSFYLNSEHIKEIKLCLHEITTCKEN